MQGDAARVAAAVVEKFSTVYLADFLYWNKQLLISTLRDKEKRKEEVPVCLSVAQARQTRGFWSGTGCDRNGL